MNTHYMLQLLDESRIVNLCSELVRFQTINPPGDEGKLALHISNILEAAGLDVCLEWHTASRASLIATLPGRGIVPPLIYCGHLDVMPVTSEEWLYQPFEGEVVEGKVWGRGTADMKGGVAAMLAAIEVLATARHSLKGDLVLALTADEEVDQYGAKVLAIKLRQISPQVLVIAEPSSNNVYLSEKGQLWLRFTTYGKNAHGAMPYLGLNAIDMMLTLLDALKNMRFPHQEHSMLGSFTQNIGTIIGGQSTNLVPEQCVVTIDLRTVPGQNHDSIIQKVQALIEDITKCLPGFRSSVEVISSLPSIETSPAHPIAQKFLDVATMVTGKSLAPMGVPYTTDAAILVPVLNTPFVICGPGNPNLAHQANEYLEVDKLLDAAKIYTLFAIQSLC
jgi:succinyl-diaminopimelate desuccinylase